MSHLVGNPEDRFSHDAAQMDLPTIMFSGIRSDFTSLIVIKVLEKRNPILQPVEDLRANKRLCQGQNILNN